MIGVTNNSPQQINAALIAMKNELKHEIIIETKIEQIKSDVIDDTKTSTSKTWSSEKIANEMYPLGFIYMQLYNPNSDSPHWEKDPNQLGMTPASGCKWEEITSDFASYPYLKIGSGTTQDGHNAYHSHTGNTNTEIVNNNPGWGMAYLARYMTVNGQGTYPYNGNPWLTSSRDSPNPSHYHSFNTSYDGKSTEKTVEVNAINMKIWKVVEDV